MTEFSNGLSEPLVGLGQYKQPLVSSSVLKITNIPNDLSHREARAIFALVIDDILNIEIKDYTIWAYFQNLQTCSTTGKLLDGKFIFGKEFGPVKVEFDLLLKSPNSGLPNFNSLRLSQSQPTQASQPATQQQPGDFQKRLSVTRSRFLFSDPFGAGNSPATSGQQPPSVDLPDFPSKSILLMDSHDSPWGNQLPISSAPQTPGASHAPFEWGQTQGQPQPPSAPNDRRRTSSAFFNNNNLLQGSNQGLSLNSINTGNLLSNPNVASSQPSSQDAQATSQTANSVPQTNSSQPATHPLQTSQNNSSQTNSQSASQSDTPQISPASGQNTPIAKNKDVPDLSLLARVPPPANPADQNPPCNTLYVGNLPPDATEQELRALFSPQKGFRRLSFRTKNLSLSNSGHSGSHNHGPMCFVEFEDVAHATRALAELYGRTLPRPGGSNGKGGIRLSFSKNPLGVRGPGNPRRSTANQVTSGTTSSVSTPSNVSAYNYQNYAKN